ncbi:MAG: DinB family protein [Rhodothermales bacterium]|nr:DinB family protein [Rhodothermales bacterium]
MIDSPLEQVIEAWHTNHRINTLLMENISDEGMKCTLSTRGGRNVCRQFAHIHTNRVWQLESRAKKLASGLHKFATAEEPDHSTLYEHHEASTEAVTDFFRMAAAGSAGVRTFKKGLVVHLCYFVAHESHHRGNILLTLKQSGHAVDKRIRDIIWDWDRR